MRLTIYFFIALITSTISTKAQSDNSYPALRFGANFYSESFWMSDSYGIEEDDVNYYFNNNGINIEAQYTVIAHQSKEKDSRKMRGSEVLNVGLNGYFYGITNQSNNSIFTIDIGLEKEFFFGLQIFGKVGIGNLNTKLIGDVYSVSTDGTVTNNNGLSSNETILPASFGIGWDLESVSKIPLSIRARTMHFSKTFGQFSTYKAGLLLGLEYRFTNLNVSPLKEL